MTLPLSISEKLLRVAGGEQLPASQLRHEIITELVSEGIITESIAGRTKKTLSLTDTAALDNWLHNKYNIHSLAAYIATLKNEAATRAGLVQDVNNSKARSRRSFKGFLVSSYDPTVCSLNGSELIIHPVSGTFQFIYDYEGFMPPADAVIIGMENAENFRWLHKQRYLFPGIRALFVCRYPQEQSKDLLKWLKSIPNPYLHFGDFDFAGINIYLQEYKKHLAHRASFFIPHDIERLLQRYGNRSLYDRQKLNATPVTEDNLQKLIALLHKYKVGLEQESVLIEEKL